MSGDRDDEHPPAKPALLQPHLPGLFNQAKTRRLATPRELALDIAHNRLIVVALLFMVAWLVIGGRLAYLTLRGDGPDTQIARNTPADGPAQRADITDRNGTLMATSLPTISLCVDSKNILNPDEATRQLMGVLPNLDAQKLGDLLRGDKHCAMIRRHLTPRQYYEVNKLGIAGLEFHPDERRIYPVGNVAAHVLGYTDIDDNGLAGVEKSMNDRLNDDPAPLALSIDLRVQSVMHQELAAAVSDFHAEAAAGLVMDIHTGEILSLVSLPDFDPDHAGTATDDQRFNRVTLGVYEMGSTFKIFNTALALDSGMVHMTDTFDTRRPPMIGSHVIRDFEKENRAMNVAEIFVHSSNIGSALMAQRFGGTRQRAFFTRLGLTDKLALELPEVGAPLIPPARDWNETTTLAASFGHGVAVNAVQLASAVGTIINDGVPVKPTLLKQTTSQSPASDSVVSQHTSALIRGLMRLVVTNGTAKQADVAGYLVAGKTGTADKVGANHHYLENARVSSFIGAFPANAPRYLVFALLDDPKGNAKTHGFATAGWTAAPTVSHIVAQIGPILNIPPMPKEMALAAEHQIIKPLGAQTIDGVSIEEGSDYASFETNSVQ